MAVINETLTLEDRFSASFTRFLQLGNKAAGATTRAQTSLQNYEAELNRLDRLTISYNGRLAALNQEQAEMAAKNLQNTKEYKNLESQIKQTTSTLKALESQYNAVAADADKAAASAKKFGISTQTAQAASSGLMGSLRNLAGAFLGIQTGQWLVGTSDQLTQINARLQLMTGSAEAAAEANDQIYAAAMRSRGAYTDMADLVSQLGTLAPDAFSDPAGNLNTGELIAFAEQLQKQMALSGTSTQAAQAAMLQLTQGLASGVLRGEELNSVLEQTPMVAQTIADYMGVNVGTMRELASEGAITADVVKNALLGAAQETNAAFAQMPMTWGQVWTQMQNMAIQALQPVLNFINFLANNMGVVVPIVAGATAAMLGFAAASWVAAGGLGAIKAALVAINPIAALIGLAIGAIVGLVAAWVQSVGGLEIAWMTAKNTILNVLDKLYLGWKTVSSAIYLAMSGVFTGLLSVVEWFVNAAIGAINFVIDGMNALGADVEHFAEVTFGTEAQQNLAQQAQDTTNELADAALQNKINQFQRDKEIAMARLAASKAAKASEPEIPKIPDYTPQLSGISGSVKGISGSVKGIEKAVKMSDEDIKALVDVAERRYVNQVNLTSQTPVITVNGANTGRTAQDRRALADAIEQILREEWASGSVRSTAYA